jgi:hypothetical protein
MGSVQTLAGTVLSAFKLYIEMLLIEMEMGMDGKGADVSEWGIVVIGWYIWQLTAI